MRSLVAVLALSLLAACSSGEQRAPDYEPVPDPVLFSRAAQVEGIRDIELTYSSTRGNRGYGGDVHLVADLTRPEAGEAVATVYAILRQGRYNTPIGLSLFQRDRPVDPADLPGVPLVGTSDELLDVFGPQPGDGTPSPR